MSWGKMITLKSSDGEIFEVEDAAVRKSELITHIIEDDGADKEISLPHVTSKILSTVIVYCRKHVETPMSDDELRTWDAEFVKVDQATLSDLVLAANYLCIKSLLDLTCQAVADMIIGENS